MASGPKTRQGKAVAKMNALTHGLRSSAPVIPGEDAREWERHKSGVTDAFFPIGTVEGALAERVALLLWRLARVARYETAMLAGSIADTERDYERGEEEHQRHQRPPTYQPNTPTECRAEIREAMVKARLLRDLKTREDHEELAGTDVGLILHKAVEVGMRRTHDEEFDADEVTYPDLPEGGDWDDVGLVTVGTLRGGFGALAAAAKVDGDELIEAVTYHYECEARGAKMRLAEVERELARLGAARLMLAGEDLEKVTRYEAHLHRQLVQTLRELEAMQGRRHGYVTPLARLDVGGLDLAG